MNKYEESFDISVVGDETGEKWIGNFKVKTKLSHMDNIRKDRYRRELLGPTGGEADALTTNLCIIFSELSVRIIEAPKWWEAANNGLNLEDQNVIAEIFNKAREAEKRARDALNKAAESAAKELAKE